MSIPQPSALSAIRQKLRQRKSLPSLGSCSPSDSLPRLPLFSPKDLGPISRDISHIRDLKLRKATSSVPEDLFQVLGMGPAPVETEPVNLTLLPPAELPESVEASLDAYVEVLLNGSRDLNRESLAVYKHYTKAIHQALGKPTKRSLEELSEPQIGVPSGRREVEVLEVWVKTMLVLHGCRKPMQRRALAIQAILKCAFKEIVRQVGVHCIERAKLLEKVVTTLNDVLRLYYSSHESKVKKLQEKLKATHSDHLEALSRLQRKHKAKQKELTAQIKRLQEELKGTTEDKQELFRDIQHFKRRVEFLQGELDTAHKSAAPSMAQQQRSSFDVLVLRKHASTLTEDADFIEVSKFQSIQSVPLRKPLLLVGAFEDSGTFHKSAAYTAVKGKVVPWDFPASKICVPSQRTACVATVDKIEEILSKEFVEIAPNIVKEIDTEEIVNYNSTIPITMMLGVYSLILGKPELMSRSKGTQHPTILPCYTTETSTVEAPAVKRVRKSRPKRNSNNRIVKETQESSRLSFVRRPSLRRVSQSKPLTKENSPVYSRAGAPLIKAVPIEGASELASSNASPDMSEPYTTTAVVAQPNTFSEAASQLGSWIESFSPIKRSPGLALSEYTEDCGLPSVKLFDKKSIVLSIERSTDLAYSPSKDSSMHSQGIQVEFSIPIVSYVNEKQQRRLSQRTQTLSPDDFKKFSIVTRKFAQPFKPKNFMIRVPSATEPFILGKRQLSIDSQHPGPAFIQHFLSVLNQNTTFYSPITLRSLLKVINKVYTQALAQDISRIGSAACILYDFMLKSYGLKSVAEDKLRQVIVASLTYADNCLRVRNFRNFLGLTADFSYEGWRLYLQILDYCTQHLPCKIHLNKDAAPKYFVLQDRLVSFLESHFKLKLSEEELVKLLEATDKLALQEASKVFGRSISISVVDCDEAYGLALLQSPQQLQSAQDNGQSETLASNA